MIADDFILNFIENVVEEAEIAAEFPRRQIIRREDPFLWNEKAFRKDFRLSKALVIDLMAEIEPVIRSTTKYDLKTKVLCALSFFAQGSYQTPVGENRNINMSQPSASRCISEIVVALNEPSVFNRWVHFPQTYQEMNAIVRDFYRTNGFPGVIRRIDCTHVAIVPPASTLYNEKSYVNRKQYHSINTQLICDAYLKILNVNARFPGGTHDCHIWNNSNVLTFMDNLHRIGQTNYHLIGDSGYPLRPWCLTPIREAIEDSPEAHYSDVLKKTRNNSNVLTFMENLHRIGQTNYHLIGDSGYPLRPWCLTPIREAIEDSPEAHYSDVLKKTRSVIERCNGVLKGRFRCLIKDRVLHYTPNKASKIINACTVLHNMCILNNLEQPDYSDLDDEQLGVIREPLPELPAPRNMNRTNVNLVQGRVKQAQIVNSYFNN